MKSLNNAVFMTAILVFSFLTLTAKTNAQCVGCAPAPPGFVCVPTTIGGSGCVTDGTACTLTGACTQGSGGTETPEGRSAPCQPKVLKHAQVSIEDDIIRQVGAADTRLAIALINLSKIKVEFNAAKINFSSMDLTMEDVENHLVQPSGSPYYKEMRRRSGEAMAKDGVVITYDISINSTKSDSFVMNVTPAQGAGRSIELTLEKAVSSRGADQSEGFKAISYQFK
jgi:hypothetical protein